MTSLAPLSHLTNVASAIQIGSCGALQSLTGLEQLSYISAELSFTNLTLNSSGMRPLTPSFAGVCEPHAHADMCAMIISTVVWWCVCVMCQV